ncbi:O-antigen ligase family protein [Flavobacteriaceae bacterium]|nr:O-antigen ligase family protein [Flavobacteriaceae bacterium]
MSKNLSYFILTLYFFTYLVPQYIPSIVIAYDRSIIQFFYISIVNIFSFAIIFRNLSFNDIISRFKEKSHIISYILFLVIALISVFVAENYIESLFQLTQFVNFFLAFVSIVIFSSNQNINFYKYFIFISLIAVFIESFTINYLVYSAVQTNGDFLSRNNAFSGPGANTIIAAFSLMMKSIVPLYLIFKTKNKWILVISLILIYSSFLSVLLLMSRGAVLSMVFVFVFIILFTLLTRRKMYYIKTSSIMLVFFLSLSSYNYLNEKNISDILVDRFSTVSDPQSDNSVNERVNFFSTAISSIKKRPLLGIGIGNWKIKSIDLSKDIIEGYRVPYYAHNDFLQFTAEIGILGGLSFIYFIFYPFLFSLKSFLKSTSLNLHFLVFMICGVYIIDSMINFPAHRPMIFIYLCFTLALFHQSKSLEKK